MGILSLKRFNSDEGREALWELIISKIIKEFSIPNYLFYNIFIYNENLYDLSIHSHIEYHFKVEIYDKITVYEKNIFSTSIKSIVLEYYGNNLFLA